MLPAVEKTAKEIAWINYKFKLNVRIEHNLYRKPQWPDEVYFFSSTAEFIFDKFVYSRNGIAETDKIKAIELV